VGSNPVNDFLNILRELLSALKLSRSFRRGDWTDNFRQEIKELTDTAKSNYSKQLVIRAWMANEDSLVPLAPKLEIWLTILYKKKVWSNQDQKLISLISSCFCIADKNSIISKIKPEILSRNTQILAQNPVLLVKFHDDIHSNTNIKRKSHEVNKHFKQITDKAKHFIERTQSITQYIESNPEIKSIAIVGNGPNLLEAKNGEIIDRADLVIRFNNIVIDENNVESTGRKTDIWMINPGYKIDKSTNIPSSYVWLSSYYPYFRPNSYWHDIDGFNFLEHHYCDHDHWHQLVKRLNAPPSAGLLCVTSLADTGCELHVFGFSGISCKHNDDIRDLSKDRYTAVNSENHYGDSHKKSDRHNWLLESVLLNELKDRVSFY